MAMRSPVSADPMNNQFFLLWKAFHKKKNWLFIGSSTAGDKGAIIYSLIGSCRRLGINPHQYLAEVISMLPAMTIRSVAELEPLTPSGWARN